MTNSAKLLKDIISTVHKITHHEDAAKNKFYTIMQTLYTECRVNGEWKNDIYQFCYDMSREGHISLEDRTFPWENQNEIDDISMTMERRF